MKKFVAVVLTMAMLLSLCACTAIEEASSEIKEVHITAGKIEPGMTAKDVFVEVTIDNQPVPCRVTFTGFAWDGYWEMEEDEAVSENFFVCLNVFYSLPKGCDVENINVTMECDGGQYDGTGSISFDEDGNVEAWSRAFYGEEPEPPQTQPTEETVSPTVATVPPTEATVPPTEATVPPAETTVPPTESTVPPTEATVPPTESTVPPTEATTPPTEPTTPPTEHTHDWTELPGPGILDCTVDGAKNFVCDCGETKTEIIAAPGHDLNEWSITDPTCTKNGSKITTCKRCSAGFVVELVATGHDWSSWINKTGRVHFRTCSVCGAEMEANHTIPENSVTCTGCGADIIN